MVFLSIISLIIVIGLKSSQISSINLNRVAIIVLLLSGVLTLHSMYFNYGEGGQLGSGVGIFNGLFQVTQITQGIDLFIYIVGALILLMSETQVNNGLQLNKEELELNRQNVVPPPLGEGSNPNSMAIIGEYPIIVLFSVLGMTLLISSYDLVSFFLSIELQSFALYILATVYRDSESATSAGLKYFLLGSLSSAIILLGSGLVYGFTGLTSFEGLYMLCSLSKSMANENIEFCVLLIIVGLLFKMAAAPFHNWSISVYPDVPTLVTAWLTTMPKISVLVFILEFQGFAVLNNWSTYTLVLSISTLLSLIIGSLGGLVQYNIKRLLAYSTISHVGFMLLVLAINTISSIEAFLFYLLQYSLVNTLTFFVLIAFGLILPITKNIYSPLLFISQLKGQYQVNPLLCLSLVIVLFSLAGIPPLVGFFAKLEVLYSSMFSGYYFLSIIAIITSVISAVYYLRVIRVIYFESLSPPIVANATRGTTENISNNYCENFSSFIIANLTLLVILFCLNPNILLHSVHLLTLSQFLT